MIETIKTWFWKVYKIKYSSTNGKQRKMEFIRGFPWDVITRALERANVLSKENKSKWVVDDIERLY